MQDFFDRKEALMAKWLEWRKGPLAKCSAEARELLFQFLWYVDEDTRRHGYLDSALGEADGFFSRGEIFRNRRNFGQISDELMRLGFIEITNEGKAFSPQMVRGEI